MAKDDANDFVKLGEKAHSFSCPTTGFNLTHKGQIKELLPTFKASKKVQQALRGGHLTVAKESEVKAYKKAQSANASKTNEVIEDEETELDPKFLMTKGKAALVTMALDVRDEDDEEDVKTIEKYNKEQLVEFIIRKNEESSEDDEDEDDEDEEEED